MSWTPTDAQVEKAVETFRDNYSFRQHDAEWIARSVLVAVGPMIAAQGVREYVAAARENGWIGTWDAFDALNDAEQWADTIEKEEGA